MIFLNYLVLNKKVHQSGLFYTIYFDICSISSDIKGSPEASEHTRMNPPMIKIAEVLNKVFVEIIYEILKCIMSSFISKS